MTSDRFAALVHESETLARTRPGAYRLRLVLLGGLGYAFVWGLLLAAVGVTVLLVLSAAGVGPVRIPVGVLDNLVIPVVAFVVLIARALWVPLSPPEGEAIDARDFPRLFAMIDRVRREVGGPRVHAVLLDEHFNASISQVPRLGVFGWYRNYLTLGVPLMAMVSPRELEAIVAHEYGHLVGSHGMMGTWIYRIRATWGRLLHALEQKQGLATGLVRRFFDWYAPYFNACSFAMARAHEYEADHTAAGVSGPETMGRALVSVSAYAPFVEQDFWNGVLSEAEHSSVPTASPFATMADRSFGPSPERASELLSAALAAESDLADTHPSLSERLGAIGVEPDLPRKAESSAADEYLGPRLEQVTAQLDEGWRQRVGPYFAERNAWVVRSRARLRELEAAGPEDAAALGERARLVDDLNGREEALPLFRRLLALAPDDSLAMCIVGFEELRAGRDAGIELIERGMSLDETLIVSGCQAIRDHLASVGRMEEATRYHERLVERYESDRAREAERNAIPFEDAYGWHHLPDDALAVVEHAVATSRRVLRAYLVRKRDTLPPLYVLAVMPRPELVSFGNQRAGLAQEIARELDVPHDISVVVMDGDNRRLLKFVKRVEGARIR